MIVHVQVGDKDRGYLLELLLTKIRYARGCEELISNSNTQTTTSSSPKCSVLQIVGMSATMPNVSEVAKWLQVPLFSSPSLFELYEEQYIELYLFQQKLLMSLYFLCLDPSMQNSHHASLSNFSFFPIHPYG